LLIRDVNVVIKMRKQKTKKNWEKMCAKEGDFKR
jgi:hypothetical protein